MLLTIFVSTPFALNLQVQDCKSDKGLFVNFLPLILLTWTRSSKFLGKEDTAEARAGFVSMIPLGRPCDVTDVANACTLSEVWFGYSDRMQDLVVVNVSEGIGTGIFANGHLLRGEAGVAGEFGHIQLDPNGLRCGCGGKGCWETIASNRAGLRYYTEITQRPLSSFDARSVPHSAYASFGFLA